MSEQPVTPEADRPADQVAAPSPAVRERWRDRSADDADVGWGSADDRSADRDDEWYLRERPPHHGG